MERLIRRAILIGTLLMAAILTICVTRPAKPTGFETYVVKQGDTLWEIAKDAAPKGEDIRRVVQIIKAQNALENSGINVGELLDVPVYGE